MIHFYRHHLKTCASECHGVRSDAATEIDHAAYPGLHKPACVIVGYRWPRCLLETGPGEEHLTRSLAELRLCLPTQRSLGEGSCREIGAIPRTHPRGGC